MYVVGFTGAREGSTPSQTEVIVHELRRVRDGDVTAYFLHGDCVGADAQIARVARELGFTCWAFPGCDHLGRSPLRARTSFNDVVVTPSWYLTRDQLIVDLADEVLAVAGPRFDTPRSGTGYTVRYARKVAKPTRVVRQNGTIET